MATQRSRPTTHLIQSLFELGVIANLPDDQLIERYLAGDGGVGSAAFEVLVRRYGPLVHGACLLILKDRHEAEDAFQATFLVLARKASSIRRRDALAPWLLGVARRVAVRLKVKNRRGRTVDRQRTLAASEWYSTDGGQHEEMAALHEEIGWLPARLQRPLLLCSLEGMSYEEAALILGVSKGAVRGRLARARARLRGRLTRRGLAPDHALPLLVGCFREAAKARASLITATVRSAIPTAVGRATVAGPGSQSLVTLSTRGIEAMRFISMKTVIMTLTASLVAAGLGAVVLGGGEQAAELPAVAGATTPPTPGEAEQLQGTWIRIATESGGVSRLLPKDQRNPLRISGANFHFGPVDKSTEVAKLDPTKTPKVIELTPTGDWAGPLKGKTYFGIYEVEDGTLMLCLDIYHESKLPQHFATKPGDRLVIDLYKRTGP